MDEPPRKVIIEQRKRVYDGFFKIDEISLWHSRYDGEMQPVTRLVFERGDSATALLHDPARDIVILTEQFRLPTFEKGPGWLIEPVAGSVEDGEAPEACIRREIQEEIGYEVGDLRYIAKFYVSPGGTSERIFLYYAEVNAAQLTNPEATGIAEQQEDVRRIEMSTTDFFASLDDGAFEDAKLLVAAFWLRLQLRK